MKVFFCSRLQMSPALNLFVTDVIRSEFAACCSRAHVLTQTFTLALGSMQGVRVVSRGGRRSQNLAPYLGNISSICKRNINMHFLALGKRIQAKPSLEFTWTIPMTAGSIQTLPSPSSSQILAILFKLDTSFPLPSSPRHPRTAEQNIPSRDRVGRTTCERQNCTEAGSCVISIHQPNHKSQVEMDQVFSLLETEVGRKTVSLSSHCLSLAPEHKIQFQTPCYRMPKSPQCHEHNGT